MDIAVFSDIHGNHSALQACIDYAVGKGITHFMLLGDYVTDCPNPQKTMELIYVLKQYFNTYIVRGNREEYLLNYKKSGAGKWRKGSASGALLYTYENLTDKDFNFFDSLPNYKVFEEKGFPVFEYCHGSPTHTAELLYKEKRNTKKVIAHLNSKMLLHGHTHIQGTYIYRDKKAVNPGSVGLPWYYGGKTQFCILHGDGKTWEEEFIQLDYNKKEILREFKSSPVCSYAPAWAAVTMHTIRTGVDLNQTVLLRAMRLCEQERGKVKWPNIPEKYWAIALKENYIDLYGKDIPHEKKG
ncbi:metallophosphoesterase family protein [Butyrivibrio sp. YAB3001]|uniref:metallophosphoesterase family protein n=1 Tax=Butyrivibrio sp. YAB3001 TaxID=1520812 RepID=UPI0008F61C5F|nr:metallophosphoesterase family protein [Butyrivibrio sp. YAB3001]SFB69748.1 Predicted phosphodiesterase [Butyrivibrio sp. YAB3001]